MRTLQEKYNGVNEGAFSKDQFLRDARLQLPNLVTQYNGYDDAVKILKNRGMLSEGIHDRNILSRPLSNPDFEPLERSPEELGIEADRGSERILKATYYNQIQDPKISDDELRSILSGKGVKGFGGRSNAVNNIINNRSKIQEVEKVVPTKEKVNVLATTDEEFADYLDNLGAEEFTQILNGLGSEVTAKLKSIAGKLLVKAKILEPGDLEKPVKVEENMLQKDYEDVLSRSYEELEASREYKPGFKVTFTNKNSGKKYEGTVVRSLGPGRFTFTAEDGKTYNNDGMGSNWQITQVINNNDPDADPTGLGKWAKLTPRQKADMDAARAQNKMQEATQPKPTKKGLADYRYKPTNDMDKYPYEQILRGLRVELETLGVAGTPTPEEYTKALAKVHKNLEKDGIFYTNQIAGIKSNRKRTDVMVDATPKAVVDKENGMQKAALKEAIKSVIKNILKEDDSSVNGLFGDEEKEERRRNYTDQGDFGYESDFGDYFPEPVDEEEYQMQEASTDDDAKIAEYEQYTYTLNGEVVEPKIAFYDHYIRAELDGRVYRVGSPDKTGTIELSSHKGKTGMYTEDIFESVSLFDILDEGSSKHSTAWHKGYKAFNDDIKLSSNPYKENPQKKDKQEDKQNPQEKDWAAGWDKAQSDASDSYKGY